MLLFQNAQGDLGQGFLKNEMGIKSSVCEYLPCDAGYPIADASADAVDINTIRERLYVKITKLLRIINSFCIIYSSPVSVLVIPFWFEPC